MTVRRTRSHELTVRAPSLHCQGRETRPRAGTQRGWRRGTRATWRRPWRSAALPGARAPLPPTCSCAPSGGVP